MRVTIIGGGLWGGLLAWMLHHKRPEIPFILYEADERFGGNHTWSFHRSDLSEEDFELIKPLITHSWRSYQVKFPSYSKEVKLEYCTVTSEHFDEVLKRTLPKENLRLGQTVKETPSGVVFDLRGSNYAGPCGYQKFVGLEIVTEQPHGMDTPIIMDATVPQIDGFRFIYYLPFSHDRILIEDTRYSENSDIDSHEILKGIFEIARSHKWTIKEIVREEKGCLPIPFNVPENNGFQNIFHDTTGYSLPDAVRIFSGITDRQLDQNSVNAFVLNYFESKLGQRRFFTLLNRFMFHAAGNEERYRPLEFFYRSNESQISKFYRGEMNAFDRFRFFAGKPPVSITKALEVIIKDGF